MKEFTPCTARSSSGISSDAGSCASGPRTAPASTPPSTPSATCRCRLTSSATIAPDDRDRYQTVFAQTRGSIAAPTAGLHFTPALLAALAARGVDTTAITLHVGYGTFQPVRVDRVEDHRVEAERYEISARGRGRHHRARSPSDRRIIAVGTTTTRTLEAVARAHDGAIVAGTGETDLFIYPGFRFRVVGGLLTNFHLPRSSLLMLVSAFAGRELVRTAYDAAIAERYRFYSYGDAMLIL